MNKYMTVQDVGNSKIVIIRPSVYISPRKLIIKQDGAKGDKPSFVMLFATESEETDAHCDFSLETITDCFNQLGYDIIKKH